MNHATLSKCLTLITNYNHAPRVPYLRGTKENVSFNMSGSLIFLGTTLLGRIYPFQKYLLIRIGCYVSWKNLRRSNGALFDQYFLVAVDWDHQGRYQNFQLDQIMANPNNPSNKLKDRNQRWNKQQLFQGLHRSKLRGSWFYKGLAPLLEQWWMFKIIRMICFIFAMIMYHVYFIPLMYLRWISTIRVPKFKV